MIPAIDISVTDIKHSSLPLRVFHFRYISCSLGTSASYNAKGTDGKAVCGGVYGGGVLCVEGVQLIQLPLSSLTFVANHTQPRMPNALQELINCNCETLRPLFWEAVSISRWIAKIMFTYHQVFLGVTPVVLVP